MTNTNYRDLQATLKSHRSNGVTLQCKLTATMDILQAELLRIQNVVSDLPTPTLLATALDTYVMHNNAQPITATVRIANNYLHYICLTLAYVYATIYIGCQLTHRAIALTTLHIKAWYLIAVIKRTLHDMSFKPFYLDSWPNPSEVTKLALQPNLVRAN